MSGLGLLLEFLGSLIFEGGAKIIQDRASTKDDSCAISDSEKNKDDSSTD